MYQLIQAFNKQVSASLQDEIIEIRKEQFDKGTLNPMNTTVSEWDSTREPNKIYQNSKLNN